MSILIDETTPIIVQGMTGDKGSFHTKEMVDYGSNVVGGVTPGKGGTTHLDLGGGGSSGLVGRQHPVSMSGAPGPAGALGWSSLVGTICAVPALDPFAHG